MSHVLIYAIASHKGKILPCAKNEIKHKNPTYFIRRAKPCLLGKLYKSVFYVKSN